MGSHPWFPRGVAAGLALIGLFSGVLAGTRFSAAPPCPPSHLRIANRPTPADTTAPTVFLTSPGAGATVSGTVVISACASDAGGIAGVQFKVDGANIGAEDAAPPYSMSWNTSTSANGSHAVTAVARDAAGNTRTSASVSVTVSNGTGGTGIAARYPGDAGIEADPAVVFVERFNESTLANLFARWNDVLNGAGMSFAGDAPPGSPVARSLTIPWIGAGVSTGGHLYRQITPAVTDTLYVRYYIKYPAQANYTHSGVWMGGYNPPLAWPNPQAGVKPNGADRFSGSAETFAQTGQFDHYDYWTGMRQSGDLNYWGNLLLNNATVRVSGDQWTCVEHMIKLNNPVTASNGERAIWVNGVKVSHLGPGFPNGTWNGGVFTQSPTGTAFPGFQWRTDANLALNYIWLQNYSPDTSAGARRDMMFAHLVAAKSYIGCLAGGATGSTWPNEPSGMTLLSDWSLDQQPPFSGDVPIAGSGGWKIVSLAAPGSARGWAERVLDAAAPLSPSNVYDFVYPQGMVEGNAPATLYFDGIGRKEVYVGFWWKPSSPFDYGPNGNKIAFIFNGGGAGGGQQFMILLPDGKLHVLPEYPGDFRWRDANVTATTVTLGAWHRIEWYSNVTTGTMKFWLDGVLQGSYTDVRNTFNFDMFQFSPTWGGNIGARKAQTDHYWFDHVRLTAR